ncbi:MAG TPA: DUF3520 domain-containing protein [Candidatus Hydrogenedentes bacterium]|nr:DUF3520 domain-containing protein [Candidatus Hydrogenedentota bacterium]
MTMKLDNEKLTAYVLGELDEKERQAVEKALETDQQALQIVTELRATAKFATEALKAEVPAALTDEQRNAVRDKAAAGAQRAEVMELRLRKPRTPRRWLYRGAAFAATVAIVAGLAMLATPSLLRSRTSSKFVGDASMQLPSQEELAARRMISKLPPEKRKEVLISSNARRGIVVSGRPMEDRVEGELAKPRASRPSRAVVAFTTEPPREPVPGTQPGFIEDPNKVYWPNHNTEAYDRIVENDFLDVGQNPLSTFSIDVDTASYANVRRFLTQNTIPPPDAVRIEEMVNYFSYDYVPPDPDGEDPFSANMEVAGCPWNPDHRLARIALKGREMPWDERPATNLVFLIDVSGSMSPENKLPLLKQGIKLLVDQLGEADTVSMVVYAGASGLVLPPTSGENREAILDALDRLKSGGSTNGGAGIQLAYDTAVGSFIQGGINRVILATDGDFNVGTTNQGDLIRLIEQRAKSGVFLTVLGFGMGNIKDSTLEKLADKGNGNYAYIDTLNEARKVLVEQIGGTLVTIAKDVKIQIEFNPAQVRAYRLIGYENRILAAEDFNDDTKDAGEIGAGHTVTALYELVPAGQDIDLPSVDPLKYRQKAAPAAAVGSNELLTLKLRYKQPDGDKSKKLEFPIVDEGRSYAMASNDFKFAASVASFGMVLRDSKYKGNATFDSAVELAEEGRGQDKHGYRAEFIELVRKAKTLSR